MTCFLLGVGFTCASLFLGGLLREGSSHGGWGWGERAVLDAVSVPAQKINKPWENPRARPFGEFVYLASGSSEDSPNWLATMAGVTVSRTLCFRRVRAETQAHM